MLQFDFKSHSSKFLVQRDLISHSKTQGGATQLPMDMALTEFHAILLHRDRWVGQVGGASGWGRWVEQAKIGRTGGGQVMSWGK